MPLDWLYLLNAILPLVVGFYGVRIYWHAYQTQRCQTAPIAFLLSVPYVVYGLLSLIWGLGIVRPGIGEPLVILSLFLSVLAGLFLYLAYHVTRHHHLLYWIGVFFLALAWEYFLWYDFLVVAVTALLIIMVSSLYLDFYAHYYLRRVGKRGIGFALVGLAMLGLVALGFPVISAIQDAVMVSLFVLLYRHTKSCERRVWHKEPKPLSLPVHALKLLVLMVSLNVFLLVGTLATHEFGHALAAEAYQCEYTMPVYSVGQGQAHLDISCALGHSELILLLSGFLITSLTGAVLFITGNAFVRDIGLLVAGFGVVVANIDFLEIGMTPSIIFIADCGGMLLVMLALIRMISAYVEDHKKTRTTFC